MSNHQPAPPQPARPIYPCYVGRLPDGRIELHCPIYEPGIRAHLRRTYAPDDPPRPGLGYADYAPLVEVGVIHFDEHGRPRPVPAWWYRENYMPCPATTARLERLEQFAAREEALASGDE